MRRALFTDVETPSSSSPRSAMPGLSLPIIDIAPLFGRDAAARAAVAGEIEAACSDTGFFYVRGHGVSDDVLARLDAASRRFFALPRAAKERIAMERGGGAGGGRVPPGGGRPDSQ